MSRINRQTLTVGATVTALTVPIGANSAEIAVIGADSIRYATADTDTAVTASSNGTKIATGSLGLIEGLSELKAFRAISTDGSDHFLEITYFN
jgi:hypothetical protein